MPAAGPRGVPGLACRPGHAGVPTVVDRIELRGQA